MKEERDGVRSERERERAREKEREYALLVRSWLVMYTWYKPLKILLSFSLPF
jgi:hypothetical protein